MFTKFSLKICFFWYTMIGMAANRLYKSEKDKIIAGVLGGLGEYFDTDPTLLRLGFLVVTIFTGFVPGIVLYLLAALIIPRKPKPQTGL